MSGGIKYKKLQKRLGMEVGIGLAVLAVLGGGVYFLGGYLEEYEGDTRNLESEVVKITTEKNALRTKFNNAEQNMDLYEEAILRNPRNGKYATQQVVQQKFDDYHKRFGMENMRLSMTVRKELADPKYKHPEVNIVTSELTLAFDNVLDENVYSMIGAMQNGLLGVTRITFFKLTRGEEYSEKALETIADKGAAPLVKGELSVLWLGIKPTETAKTDSPNAPKP